MSNANLFRRVLQTGLVLSIVLATNTFGINSNEVVDTDKGITNGASEVTMKVIKSDSYLLATVPVEIPISIDTRGNVYVPDNLSIVNNTDDKTIEVTDIHFKTNSSKIEHVYAYKCCGKESLAENDNKWLEFELRDDAGSAGRDNSGWIDSQFSLTEGNWVIGPSAELPLNMKANVSRGIFGEPFDKEIVGQLIFTLAIK